MTCALSAPETQAFRRMVKHRKGYRKKQRLDVYITV